MKTRPIWLLAAAATIGTGCSQLRQAEQMIAVEGAPPTTIDTRIPGEWFMYPSDSEGMCNGMTGAELPCKDVLNVCVTGPDGYRSTKWMPQVFRCTDASPSWRDVCRTRPEAEWAFYGYTREECAEA